MKQSAAHINKTVLWPVFAVKSLFSPGEPGKAGREVESVNLSSNDLSQGQEIPSKFTCDGENVSPELHWEGVPENAKSLALVVDDPDAPMGTFYHWLVCDIPVAAKGVPQGGPLPPGSRQVANGFGKEGYGGPCPPSGTHRYFFRLYALDVEGIECGSAQEFLQAVQAHKVGETELMAPYTRK